MKRIKVFIFIDSLMVGGMHRQVLNLVNYIDATKYSTIVCTHNSPNGGLRKEFLKTKCKLYDLERKRKIDFGIIFNLIKIIKKEKPDIIFITEPQNLFYYQLSRIQKQNNHIKQIGSFRALTFWLGHRNRIYKIIDNILAKWLYSTSDAIIVNSLALKNNYDKILDIQDKKQLQVLYNGSDFCFQISKTPLEIRRELNLKPDEIMVVMVARLDPWKDFYTLFNAIEIVKSKCIKIKYFIIGEGEMRKELEQTIFRKKLTSDVFLLGEKSDVYSYINACDISVLSTNGEGFSNSILESMALSKPVIATDVGGNKELIGNDGRTGLLIPAKSPFLFAEAIYHLSQNQELRIEIGLLSRLRILDLCDIKKIINSYENLFMQLCKD